MNCFIKNLLVYLFFLPIISCQPPAANSKITSTPTEEKIEVPTKSKTNKLSDRIETPLGFKRLPITESSYAHYLRTIPLKPEGSKARYYNGDIKPSEGIYMAVIDLDIGHEDLHQCADAIMRLKAEYLWQSKQYDKIHFNLTNGFRVDYSEWMKGRRMIVEGNKTYWDNQSNPSNTYEDFWQYMELIFMYAGTASLEKELISVPLSQMKIGDVLIKGGFPGHAVVIMDMAINESTGQKIFLMAQSYMPAQEAQILINRENSELSPWYELLPGKDITSPQWDFSPDQLKRFKD